MIHFSLVRIHDKKLKNKQQWQLLSCPKWQLQGQKSDNKKRKNRTPKITYSFA